MTEAADVQNAAYLSDDGEENGDDFEVISEGLASTVSKTLASVDHSEPQFVVVKSSTTKKKWAKEPHDIIKECRILQRLSHPNIILVFDSLLDRSESTMNIWMPFIPHSLDDLLNSPSFVPRPRSDPTTEMNPKIQLSKFLSLTRSIMTQILHAVGYLHAQSISHRDIKPANVLLTLTGSVTLIDFGISWDGSEDDRNDDMWPETKDRMYFEVSTGPYRAPELLFGIRSYDAYAIDLWSLGTVFAEFFTKLVPSSTDDDYPSYTSSPFTSTSSNSDFDSNARYTRESLFDGSRGELGLAWSIFKILGTPREPKNEEEENQTWAWPGFNSLPDAHKVDFKQVDGVELDEGTLSNLPPKETRAPAIDLIRSFLRYPPERRITAKDALEHTFLSSEIPLMPEDLDLEGAGYFAKVTQIEFNGTSKTLGDLLLEALN
ncbi:kinase-like domain-containing protein [Rhodocollybia butyracea]|uniref:cyclin-dependent kinase n=1 Tax=Rhodocollybia butyracea TaxID=206335 RepID=A0A9P5QCE5_9AGAR|nr:kinase-like domain-containing protein [Rhodocollybia butyracea]